MKTTKINIEKVTLNELNQLEKISRETFYETFSSGNTEENMEIFLNEAFSKQKLTAELEDGNTIFYFATIDQMVVGYLKLNFSSSQTELQDEKAIEIERIYVIQEFLGKNAGKLLFDKAIQIATEKQADYIWLGVWEENPRAINFYKKNGFVEFDQHIFKVGNDEQTDLMMRLTLNK